MILNVLNCRSALLAALISVVAGCANLPDQADSVGAPTMITGNPSVAWAYEAPQVPLENAPTPNAKLPDDQMPMIIRGTDRTFSAPRSRPVAVLEGSDVSLRFEQAPVTDVVHAVLGEILELPYSIHQPVGGAITLHTYNPLPRSEVFSVLEATLQANGLIVVKDAAGLYHVGSPDKLRGIAPAFSFAGGRVLPAGQNLIIVPLQYVGAAEMADILKPVATPSAMVRVDTVRNILILAGTRAQLEGWMEIVKTFDIDILKGMSLGLFPLKYSSVREVEVGLKTLLAGTTGGATGGGVGAAGAESSGGDATPLNLPSPLAGVVRMVAIERLNALLVVTPRAHYLDIVREWIERFDQPRADASEPRLYVYPIQNGTAKHLAGLLTAVFGGESAGGGAVGAQRSVAPGLGQASLAETVPMGTAGSSDRAGAATTDGGVIQTSIGDKVRVIADERNNALLIYAPPGEYMKIEAALTRLDTAPTQILIEATIMEVSLSDELKYGLQWYFNGRLGSGSGEGQLTSGQTNNIGTSNPGFSYSILSPAGDIRAVLTALAEKSLVNVISSPSVLVQDNHTASIQVGDQQPIRSSTTISDGGTTTSSIDYKDTGVQLSVTPSSNAGGMVSMDVEQSVTDIGQVDVATGQRSFLQREFRSRVSVRSGDTVVLGGLIRDNAQRGKQGVPVLQDIPVFGALFSTSNTTSSRTELVVTITPRVMRSDGDLRALSAEIGERLSTTFAAFPEMKRRMDALGLPVSTPGVRGLSSDAVMPVMQ